MKTYANKSNAQRAAKAANSGDLNGFTLHGKEGAWYYAKTQQDAAGHIQELVPVTDHDRRSGTVLGNGLGAPVAAKAKKAAPAKKAPVMTRTAVVQKMIDSTKKKAVKKAIKKIAAKKAPVRKATAVVEYDVKRGPTQGRISGYHIDADRAEKHGVKRRSAGTIGGRLWATFDKLAAKAGGPAKLEIAVVKASKDVADFNANKVVIEFYYWRRFHGVRGRGKKQKVA